MQATNPRDLCCHPVIPRRSIALYSVSSEASSSSIRTTPSAFGGLSLTIPHAASVKCSSESFLDSKSGRMGSTRVSRCDDLSASNTGMVDLCVSSWNDVTMARRTHQGLSIDLRAATMLSEGESVKRHKSEVQVQRRN